jgi:hypothetical protein
MKSLHEFTQPMDPLTYFQRRRGVVLAGKQLNTAEIAE